MEPALGSGPSTVGDTADGTTLELRIRPCSVASCNLTLPSPEHTLPPPPPSYREAKPPLSSAPPAMLSEAGKAGERGRTPRVGGLAPGRALQGVHSPSATPAGEPACPCHGRGAKSNYTYLLNYVPRVFSERGGVSLSSLHRFHSPHPGRSGGQQKA